MKAMKSSGKHPIIGKAQVDETVFGGQESGVRGRQNKKKKNGVSRLHVRIIDKAMLKT